MKYLYVSLSWAFRRNFTLSAVAITGAIVTLAQVTCPAQGQTPLSIPTYTRAEIDARQDTPLDNRLTSLPDNVKQIIRDVLNKPFAIEPGGTEEDPKDFAHNLPPADVNPTFIKNRYRGERYALLCEKAKGIYEQGNTDDAATIYRWVLDEGLGGRAALLGLADVDTATGNLSEAMSLYRRFFIYHVEKDGTSTLKEQNIKILMLYGLLLQRTGQYDEAFAVYQKAFRSTGEDERLFTDCVMRRSEVDTDRFIYIADLMVSVQALREGDYFKVIQHSRNAIKLRPGSALAHDLLGAALRQLAYSQPSAVATKKMTDEADREVAKAKGLGGARL